jgi:hypothetical protein
MRGNKGTVDWVACGSWAGFVILAWGGIATAVQMLAARTAESGAGYGVYVLYIFYYVGYIVPYLQALYMYKSLKGVMLKAGGVGQPLQAGQDRLPVSVPCGQWCEFMLCPCTFLSSANAFVSAENEGGSSTYLHLDEQLMCPITCYTDYRVTVLQHESSVLPGGSMMMMGDGIANNNNNGGMMMQWQQPPPPYYGYQQQQQQWPTFN